MTTPLTTPDGTVVEVLSDGSTVVKASTTPKKGEEFYVQIQGSDRKYPAIILRKKDRGKGATIQTISKNGTYADLYADYEEAIAKYIQNRQQFDNTADNTQNNGQNQTTLGSVEGDNEGFRDRRTNRALRGAIERARGDKGPL